MRIFLTTLIASIAMTVFGQSFEGKITYLNTFKSKLPNVSDQQFGVMMGTTQEYMIKGGSYKSSFNGSLLQWQLYMNTENKLYSKMPTTEIIYWSDASVNTDRVLTVVINKGVTKVLDYECDEVILTCKSGVQKFYFNSKLGVDPALYTKHLYGNWYDYLKTAKALPLKSVIDNEQFSLESVATEVKAMELADKDFLLPENAKLTKSPF